ncbi:MAG: PQQ-binding-like beta-propeller repeat protein, partial [Acidobacteriota bacterium]|nr:PQQ-binding-like beta-propeller repeat protein [Acidobacteriota bacterium]
MRGTGIVLPLLAALCAMGQNHKTWTQYGGGPDSSHYSALTQIGKSNVGKLGVAWTYRTNDDRTYLFNPIAIDGAMYVLARNSSLVALNAATGREIWIHAS